MLAPLRFPMGKPSLETRLTQQLIQFLNETFKQIAVETELMNIQTLTNFTLTNCLQLKENFWTKSVTRCWN